MRVMRTPASSTRLFLSFAPGGITAIELLIVVAILSFLAALMLPAIQSSRESARRLQCSTRLRDLGLACQSFESIHHYLPSTSTRHRDLKHRWYVSLSPHVRLLPYIDQKALFDKTLLDHIAVDLPGSLPISYQPEANGIRLTREVNQEALSTTVPGFLCPSDWQHRQGTIIVPAWDTDLVSLPPAKVRFAAIKETRPARS